MLCPHIPDQVCRLQLERAMISLERATRVPAWISGPRSEAPHRWTLAPAPPDGSPLSWRDREMGSERGEIDADLLHDGEKVARHCAIDAGPFAIAEVVAKRLERPLKRLQRQRKEEFV